VFVVGKRLDLPVGAVVSPHYQGAVGFLPVVGIEVIFLYEGFTDMEYGVVLEG